MGYGILADMSPSVFHRQGRAALQQAAPHPDLCPLRGIEGCVGEQVPHGLAEERRVAGDGDPRRQRGHQPLVPLLQQSCVQRQLSLNQSGQIHALLLDSHRPCLHPGDGQHLPHQVFHPACHLKGAQQVFVPVLVDANSIQHPRELPL